jgi:CheY-like chemotaxis protein
MACVVALIPDLLFGSQVQGQLKAAGHAVELVRDAAQVAARIEGTDRAEADVVDVLVVDLTDPDLDGPALVSELRGADVLAGVGVLGFYAHVEPAVRDRALAAGFDRVVPRSRMAREGAELIAALSPA